MEAVPGGTLVFGVSHVAGAANLPGACLPKSSWSALCHTKHGAKSLLLGCHTPRNDLPGCFCQNGNTFKWGSYCAPGYTER